MKISTTKELVKNLKFTRVFLYAAKWMNTEKKADKKRFIDNWEQSFKRYYLIKNAYITLESRQWYWLMTGQKLQKYFKLWERRRVRADDWQAIVANPSRKK